MHILVGGSDRSLGVDEQKIAAFRQLANDVGRQLAERGHTLIVESNDPRTFDFHVIEGAVRSNAPKPIQVVVHRVEAHGRIFQNYQADGSLSISHMLHSHPLYHNLDLRYGARVAAVQQSDVAILVGGAKGTEALLKCCNALARTALTVRGFGGQEHSMIPRIEASANQLQAHTRLDIPSLVASIKAPGPDTALSLVRLSELFAGHAGFFISYRRDQIGMAVADHVEVLLRRQGAKVFRDEDVLDPDDKLWPNLLARIDAADTFVSIWSDSYRQSRSCQRELEYALECRDSGKLPRRIVLLRIDDTPYPDAAKDRLQLEATDRSSRINAVSNLLDVLP